MLENYKTYIKLLFILNVLGESFNFKKYKKIPSWAQKIAQIAKNRIVHAGKVIANSKVRLTRKYNNSWQIGQKE